MNHSLCCVGKYYNLTRISQKDKDYSIRAIQDVEEEAADKNPKPDRIADGLRRTKEILEESGEIYDSATGWAKRLSDVANVLKEVIPAGAPLISFLL